MKWFSVKDKLPDLIGLYAIKQGFDFYDPSDFGFMWFDGIGFTLPHQSDTIDQLAPYRNPQYWAVIDLGKGFIY